MNTYFYIAMMASLAVLAFLIYDTEDLNELGVGTIAVAFILGMAWPGLLLVVLAIYMDTLWAKARRWDR